MNVISDFDLKRPVRIVPFGHTVIALALVAFASLVAPLYALTLDCAMPCCHGKPLPSMQSAQAAECVEHCAIRDKEPEQLPNALAANFENGSAKVAWPPVAGSAFTIGAPALVSTVAVSADACYTQADGTQIYLQNSTFLL